MMDIIFGLLAVLSALYYIAIIIYSGTQTAFSKIWILSAVGFGIAFFTVWMQVPMSGIARMFFWIFMVLGTALFLTVEFFIVNAGRKSPPANADYMIILGAKVNGREPSRTLYRRAMAALEYLKENPETIAIASGGKGEDEDITEALAIATLLNNNGIAPERIWLEDQSTSTVENIVYSRQLIRDKSSLVIIATSNFHMYRSVSLARNKGFSNVGSCSSKPDLILEPHYHVREFFAVIKDKLAGNI